MKVSLRVGFSKPEKEEKHPLEPALKLCKSLGYNSIEMCLSVNTWASEGISCWSPLLSSKDRAEIRKL